MKKALIVLFAAVGLAFAASTLQAGDSTFGNPIDIDTVMLHDATAAAVDTFTAGEACVYGPYRLTAERGQPMYKGFQVYAKAITGTTPTMTFDYQLLPSFDIADTTALWVSSGDSLDGTGINQYVDLSSKTGRSIAFRVLNYDGTECQIPAKVIVQFKKNVTYNK